MESQRGGGIAIPSAGNKYIKLAGVVEIFEVKRMESQRGGGASAIHYSQYRKFLRWRGWKVRGVEGRSYIRLTLL